MTLSSELNELLVFLFLNGVHVCHTCHMKLFIIIIIIIIIVIIIIIIYKEDPRSY